MLEGPGTKRTFYVNFYKFLGESGQINLIQRFAGKQVTNLIIDQ